MPLGFFDGAGRRLAHLTPQGLTRFTMPHLEAPVTCVSQSRKREDYVATLDTLVIEPDAQRFSLTWRVARPLKNDMFEIAQVLVGKKGREWWQKSEELVFPVPAAPAAFRA